jgi:cytochrome c peroxidase
MKIYFNEGKCINCHGGSEFAGATVSDLRGASPELIQRMQMQHSIANYDNGFYNIGVRKTLEDLGVGASHPVFGPLSYTGQKLAGKGVEQAITISPGDRVANDGAFKTPTLRNIELTGPYFHNGGTRTLTEAVEFYVRGADFYENPELDLDVHGIPELQGNPAAVEDLVAFLRGLTDERVRFQRAPFDHPELIIPNGSSGVQGGVVVDNVIKLPAVGAGGGVAIQPFEQILK